LAIRAYTSKLLGIDIANIKVNPAEIGGGFGGKTLIYLEPVAVMLSKMSGRPVKIQMTREEVFRGSGPTSGATVEVKIGAMKDGSIVAAPQVLKFQAGAFPGSPVQPGCAAFATICRMSTVGYDVVVNPKTGRPSAGRSDHVARRGSLIDDLARKPDIDPPTLGQKNAARNIWKT
jgi:CO/xanthine dehydrogenase Mo-binding subunit